MGFFNSLRTFWTNDGKGVNGRASDTVVAHIMTGGRVCDLINTATEEGQRTAYDLCAPIRAIIDYKVLAAQEARFQLVNAQGEEVNRPKELARLQMMNPRHTLLDIVGEAEFFVQLFGTAYLVRVRPVGMRRSNAASYYVLPPSKVQQVDDTGAAPSFDILNYVKEYTVTLPNGTVSTFEAEDVFPMFDTSEARRCDTLEELGNLSRMTALRDEVNAFALGYDAVADLMRHRGMLGLLSLDLNDPTDAINTTIGKEVDRMQEQLRQRYGAKSDQYKVAISKLKADYVEMSSKITDLGIPPLLKGAKDEIAYVYGVPAVLLDVQDTTFNNYGKARIAFFVNTIAPEVAKICRTISAAAELPEGLTLKPYFDHLPEFKESKRQHAQGLLQTANGLAKLLEYGVITVEDAKQQYNEYID